MSFSPKILLTLAAFLVLATSQVAHGLVVNGMIVNNLAVNVSLNCPNPAVTGTVTPLAGIPLTAVLTTLGQLPIPIASATTDVNGNAILNVNSPTILALITSTLSNIQVKANLPIPVCPLLATTSGVLRGTVQTVGTVVNGVLNATVPSVTIRAS